MLNRQVDFRTQLGFTLILAFGWWACNVSCSAARAVSPVTITESLHKELMLTPKEKLAFDKFKSAVYKDLTLDILKNDLFLLRWIRAKNLNIDLAKRDIYAFLEFIEENKIGTILEEDWSDILQDYPYYSNITDKQGRPVGYGHIGGDVWNIRRGVIQGKRTRLMRFSYRMVWELFHKLEDIGRIHPNVTKFTVLVNLNGFNPFEHICALCLSTYINLLDSYERFFPSYTHELIVINAPQAYLNLVDLLRSLLSKQTREILRIFGPNRNKWLPYLESQIDISKLQALDLD